MFEDGGHENDFLDYEDTNSSLITFDHLPSSLNPNADYDEDDDEEDEDDDDEEEEVDDDDDEDEDEEEDASSGEDEIASDDESHQIQSRTPPTTPCTIIQRRHSDTVYTSYGTPIVKRRCTYSSMHDDEQKRSVLVESYRKLRGVKKPKLQVSLLICNLIKHLEKTFTKTPPLRDEQDDEHVQYYQHPRTTYRSTSSDSIYMSPLVNDEIELTNQQYSSSNYETDKVLLSVNDSRSSIYHPSSADAYWLAQSNFAVPVVSTSDDDDVDVSLQGGGDYLDLSDNTLSSSFSSPSSSSSTSTDCCCSSASTTTSKLPVDTNNNHNHNDDYYIYHHHHHSSTTTATTGQTFFYSHNGTNTVDIITTA